MKYALNTKTNNVGYIVGMYNRISDNKLVAEVKDLYGKKQFWINFKVVEA